MTTDNDSARPTVPAALLRRELLHRAAQRHFKLSVKLGISIRQAHAWLRHRDFFEARYLLTAIRRALHRATPRAQGARAFWSAAPDAFEQTDAKSRGQR